MSIRTDRVSGELKDKIAALFISDFSHLYSGLLTVTQVKISPDLSIAKVYISLLANTTPKEQILEKISNESKQIRTAIARSMRLRHTPELVFYLDDTMEEVDKIERLFRTIQKNEDGDRNA